MVNSGSSKKRRTTATAIPVEQQQNTLSSSSSTNDANDESNLVHLSTQQIIDIVGEIQLSNITEDRRLSHFTGVYPDFAEMYPTLLEMACKRNFEIDKFKYMMNLRFEIENKNRTVEDTSKEVGQKFFDKYVEKKDVSF